MDQRNRKNWRSSILTLLLTAVFLLLIVSGCGAGGTDKKASEDQESKAKKLSNPNITIYGLKDPEDIEKSAKDNNGNNAPNPLLDAKKEFQKAYGGKVKFISPMWEEYVIKLLSMVAGGNSPDIVCTGDYVFPGFMTKGMIIPLDEYVDFNNPLIDKFAADQFKWKGKHYAFSGIGATVVDKIWYNKTMFENNGLKTPREYYDEGDWTFENFRTVAMELTQDTDRDGNIDQWGFQSWMFDHFVINNGGKYITINDDGTIVLNLSDSNTIEGFQFVQDGFFKDKYMKTDAGDMIGNFKSGKLAMTMGPEWMPSYLGAGSMNDAYDVAPFPVGPHGTPGTYYGSWNGYSIPTGAKNPEGGVLFMMDYIDRISKMADMDEEAKKKAVKPLMMTVEQYDFCMKINKESKAVFPMLQGVDNIWGTQSDLWSDIIVSNIPPATAVEKHSQALQACIDDSLRLKIPEVEAFTPIAPEDFESGTSGIMTAQDVSPVKADVTKEASEIIGGATSLKIEAPDAGGFVIRTDETKLKLPSFHVYTVTFDYKVIKAPAAGGYFMVFAMPKVNITDWGKYFGWNVMPALKDGDTGTYTCKIVIDKESQDNVIIINNAGGGIMVIDNFKVEEEK